MAQTLQLFSIISFAIAGVCLILAVCLWLFFNIPTIIGDLSGRTARRSIARIRAANEKTGSKSYKESKTNTERGKLTGVMSSSGKEKKTDENPETRLLFENKADGFGSETTGLLADKNATVQLETEESIAIVRTGGKKLEMIEEVILIHTDDVIEC